MTDKFLEAANYAEEGLLDAIKILQELMTDKSQASTTRSTAVKTYVDIAVKLYEMRDKDTDGLAMLDRFLEEFRDEYVISDDE